MGKLKAIFISAAAVCCAVLSGTNTATGEFLQSAAYFSSGTFAALPEQTSGDNENSNNSGGGNNGNIEINTSDPGPSPILSASSSSSGESGVESSVTSDSGSAGESGADVSSPDSQSTSEVETPPQKRGNVITKNRTKAEDDTDYTQFTKNSGAIDRYNFGYFDGPATVTLSSGAQIRNCTDADNSELLAASEELPWDELADADNGEPLVLIYHTHTSESFLPFGSSYDEDYPIRSVDCERNITAVGDAICEALAQRGISSVHDCKSYDYPMYTGAYYRSAETLLEILEEYPSIKIAIDIHRDGLINADGTAIAPVAEINGKTAAQFMIITGCDSPESPIPNYMQNFKLACLLQNSAEKLYPSLARPILFDYRSYNQPLFEGNLLIEMGSQANTLEEAVYTGELLGYSIAEALLN